MKGFGFGVLSFGRLEGSGGVGLGALGYMSLREILHQALSFDRYISYSGNYIRRNSSGTRLYAALGGFYNEV